MKILDIYEDFSFKQKKLSDFKGRIASNGDGTTISVLPQKDILTERVLGVDEEFVYGSKLNPRTFSLYVYFENLVDVRDIAEWLNSDIAEEFFFVGDTVKCFAMLSDMCELETYYSHTQGGINYYQGLMDLKFICYDPFYYYKEDKTFTYTTFSQAHTFDAGGSYKSYPRIKFEVNGNQNITYKLNGIQTEISGINQYCYVDGKYKSIEDFLGNKRGVLKGKYPVLKPKTNTFELISGSVAKVIIECRSRLL